MIKRLPHDREACGLVDSPTLTAQQIDALARMLLSLPDRSDVALASGPDSQRSEETHSK